MLPNDPETLRVENPSFYESIQVTDGFIKSPIDSALLCAVGASFNCRGGEQHNLSSPMSTALSPSMTEFNPMQMLREFMQMQMMQMQKQAGSDEQVQLQFNRKRSLAALAWADEQSSARTRARAGLGLPPRADDSDSTPPTTPVKTPAEVREVEPKTTDDSVIPESASASTPRPAEAEADSLLSAILKKDKEAKALAAAKKHEKKEAAAAAKTAEGADVVGGKASARKTATAVAKAKPKAAAGKTATAVAKTKPKAAAGEPTMAPSVLVPTGLIRLDGTKGMPSFSHEATRCQFLYRSGCKGVGGSYSLKYGKGTGMKMEEARAKATAMVKKATALLS